MFCIAVAAAHAPVLRALFALASSDPSASHHPLIPILAGGLIWRSGRSGLTSADARLQPGGLAIVVPAAAASALVFAYRSSIGADWWLTLSVLSLVMLWIGGFLLFLGWRPFRAALFPLGFLLFTVPLPGAMLDPLVQVLKHGTANTVAGLFTATGTSYHREGTVFWLPGLAIEVADQCSGIRSTIALMLTALLAGHLFLRSTWRRALLVVAILPVTILKNGLRIVVLAWLATYVNLGFLAGPLHRDGGVLFFLLALLLLTPVVVLLRDDDAPATVAQRRGAPTV
jgi:exosortase